MSEEIEEVKEPKKSRRGRDLEVMLDKIDTIKTLQGSGVYDVTGHLYRETWAGHNTSLPKLNTVYEDDQIGREFGPGKYMCIYTYLDEQDKPQRKTVHYSIGFEYGRIHREFCQMTGRECFLDAQASMPGIKGPGFQFGDLLQKDKIESLAGLVALFQGIFKPGDNGANTALQMQGEILKTLLTNKLTEVHQPNPMKQIRDYVGVLGDIQQLQIPFQGAAAPVAPAVEKSDEGGTVDKIIDLVMPMLPGILERFGGNVAAAAQTVQKENPLVKFYMKSPDAQKAFYAAACRDYGAAKANEWMTGLGIDPRRFGSLHDAQVQQIAKAPQTAQSGGVIHL